MKGVNLLSFALFMNYGNLVVCGKRYRWPRSDFPGYVMAGLEGSSAACTLLGPLNALRCGMHQRRGKYSPGVRAG